MALKMKGRMVWVSKKIHQTSEKISREEENYEMKTHLPNKRAFVHFYN